MKSVAVLAFFLVLVAPVSSVGAQIVRGTVTERTSGQPLSGVVISLERVTPSSGEGGAVSVLTNDVGRYALRAPGAGQFRVTAKKIGVRRHATDAFDLAAGETKTADIVLDAVIVELPEVKVVANDPSVCALRSNQGPRIAALWEEVRTALTATQISLRDRLFRGRIARYVRELDPRTLRVLNESRADQQGILDRAFTSLSGDSLSKVGYWRRLRDSSLVFDAPDAAVLLSPAFLRDHCYSLVEGNRDRRGLIGIAFEPHAQRPVPDIRGALWLDTKSFELRLVEFRYTRLETSGDSTRVGGEVHFARLPSGAWIVRRWFIRMPQFAHYASAPLGIDPRRPMVLIRPGIYRLVEEGGDVFAEGIRFFERPARVIGVVVDSASAPVSGGVVRLAGTPFAGAVDSAGRFVLDSLPPGNHTLVAEHERYSALGMPLGDETVSLEEGDERRVVIRALSRSEIIQRLCERASPPQRATLRLTLLDSQTGAPLASQSVWLHWTQPGVPTTSPDAERFPGVRSMTDIKGVVAFCDLPGNIPLQLELLRGNENGVPVTSLSLRPGEIVAHTVRTRRVR